jgi:glucosylceramidase
METMILKRTLKKRPITHFAALFLMAFFAWGCSSADNKSVELWLSDPATYVLFTRQAAPLPFDNRAASATTIAIDPSKTYQSIDGFGWCLTGGSARLLNQMGKAERTALLNELFSTNGKGIGSSYLRITIGASDLSDSVFSYNDIPEGETDVTMAKFTLDVEKVHLIPILKEILAINPKLKILGSPWSPPKWMKSNNDTRGGSLKPEFYDAYALYFVKFIKGMAAEGIPIDAITVQNEPLHPGNNPSLLMLAEDQAEFIKRSLGPAFKKNGIDTKIIVYDHNADRPDYPLTIFNDPEASSYVDGSAFHLYGGKIETLSDVHNAFPEKNLYFTEQWVGAPGDMAGDLLWHISTLVIGATRNWCRTVLEWNLAADPNNDPHTDRGGCDRCLGAVTIDGNNITRNPAYYIVAHAAKFVRPDAVRVESTVIDGLANVAFKNSDGKMVLIVANTSTERKAFAIVINGKSFSSMLNAGAVGTYVW